MQWVLYAISVATLYWIYDGYGRSLRLAVFVRSIFTQEQSPIACHQTCPIALQAMNLPYTKAI